MVTVSNRVTSCPFQIRAAGLKQHQPPLEPALAVPSPSTVGRDECGSAGAAPPWVFRAHPVVSDGNDRARILVPTPVIIYRAWVSVGTKP
ncbi:Endoribonuclease Dicer [Dissostichus eleginoides]|uniref:Endoribonuclease Dicer n=1 Tax=Dissostichus eleginoides TaxID=100907 RepID=A0AAD9BD40_DISEL|nr:Endoribonuclease Dicer [Dissostichus eleginoides]